jgi:hypothetical protein
MPETSYRGRRAVNLENAALRLTVTREGGHIAEIFDKAAGVNPLWSPPWPSVEPSAYDVARHPEYGGNAESKLLAGILGHNLCLDLFGGPSPEEAAAGMTVHGEASVAPYEIAAAGDELTLRTELPAAQLRFTRWIELHARAVRIVEIVENLGVCDRPIAWTQHVTLGPPFLERGSTEFRAPATRSKVFEQPFGAHDRFPAGAEFDWPFAPPEGEDLRRFTAHPHSNAYTTHLMDPARDDAFFVAFSPAHRLAFGYVWKRADFPWLGIWEENCSRTAPPWNGHTLARGMEFGVSPIPESRRAMIERGRLFGVPAYRWVPARSSVRAEYWAVLQAADAVPEKLAAPA